MANRAYRLLLALYPRPFRDRFGAEMLEFFQAKRRAAVANGLSASLTFWMTALRDLLGASAHERWHRRPRIDWRNPLSGLGGDLHRAARILRRSPALSIGVIGLMGLAVGATTVVFSVVNAVLISPLPFGDPGRIAVVWEQRTTSNRTSVGAHEFPEWERRNRTFDRMAAITYADGLSLTGAGEPLSLFGVRATSGLFEVMGVRPSLGRGFRPEEDTPGAGGVAVLSDQLWRDRFAADPRITGRTIVIDGRTYSVIGVMPATFTFPPGPGGRPPDVWMPIAEPIHLYRGRHYLHVVGRIKTTATFADAQADLATIASAIATELPQFSKGHGVWVVPLHDEFVREARPSLLLLFGAAISLALIGCANVAGLLLARGLARRRELALQLALGGTRARVARQLLAESLTLALAGGTAGILAAGWLARLLPSLVPASVLALDAVRIDGRVLAFAASLSILTGLLFGVAPILQLSRFGLGDALKRGGRVVSGSDKSRMRHGLVAGQIALAVLLAIGAGMMLRGLAALQRIDPGFQADGLLAVDLSLPSSRYPEPFQRGQFFADLIARVGALPGVTAAATTDRVALGGSVSGIAVQVEGRPAPAPGQETRTQLRVVSAGYFRTMGIPILAGREFLPSDARVAVPLIRWYPQQPVPDGIDKPQPAPAAVINRAMAQRLWPSENPVGRRVTVLLSPPVTIVGVAGDALDQSLQDGAWPELYLLDLQEPQGSVTLMVRSAMPSDNLAGAIRSAVWSLDASLPIRSVRTMSDVMAPIFGLPRFVSGLLGLFGAIALLLMVAGVYSLLVFTTSQRLPELGVRIALGADRGRILRMIAREGLVLAAAGTAAGAAAAVLAGRFLSHQFYGVSPTEPLTFVVVIGLTFAAVAAACWAPARRASRVDPIIVLRQE